MLAYVFMPEGIICSIGAENFQSRSDLRVVRRRTPIGTP
jgi:hypothetical protein